MRSYPVKEDPIRSAVNEILWYKHTHTQIYLIMQRILFRVLIKYLRFKRVIVRFSSLLFAFMNVVVLVLTMLTQGWNQIIKSIGLRVGK